MFFYSGANYKEEEKNGPRVSLTSTKTAINTTIKPILRIGGSESRWPTLVLYQALPSLFLTTARG